jgi:sulfur relay protein TusB/DsrH
MILHQILSHKPQILTDLAAIIGAKDAVLLVSDGCYQISNQQITVIASSIYIRTQDAECRGLTHLAQDRSALSINNTEWVNLILQFNKVVSWK